MQSKVSAPLVSKLELNPRHNLRKKSTTCFIIGFGDPFEGPKHGSFVEQRIALAFCFRLE